MKKEKNSLIELLRFVFAFNVLNGHGFFPLNIGCFNTSRLSVEFFFILSGYLFISSLKKYENKTYIKGIFSILYDKLIKLGLPLLIALIFNILYICSPEKTSSLGIWGYLWYVHAMIVVMITIFTLKKIIKNENIFLFVIFIIALISISLRATDFFYSWGIIRAFATIPMGMLITKIPKLKNKMMIIFGFSITSLLVLKILIFPCSMYEEAVISTILYSCLIYFAFSIQFKSKIFNYLGSLSFGLYAFQSIPRYYEILGYNNVLIHFVIIITCSILYDILKRLFLFIIKQKKLKEEIKCQETKQ